MRAKIGQPGDAGSGPGRSRAGLPASAVFASFAFLVGACGRYFAPDRNLDREVSEAEIVGEWTLTPRSLATLAERGYRFEPSVRHTLVFREGSELEVSSGGLLDGGYFAGTGRWTLRHGVEESDRVLPNRLEIRVRQTARSLGIDEEDGRLILWQFWGDPDSWEFVEYERTR